MQEQEGEAGGRGGGGADKCKEAKTGTVGGGALGEIRNQPDKKPTQSLGAPKAKHLAPRLNSKIPTLSNSRMTFLSLGGFTST